MSPWPPSFCSPSPPAADTTTPSKTAGKPVVTPSGLKYYDLKSGEGVLPKKGQRVRVHYTGWLTNGQKFDSSVDRGEPFEFVIGTGRVIKGWDEGVASMKVGGERQLHIPPELGYGDRGFSNLIPPKSVLIFYVQLLAVE